MSVRSILELGRRRREALMLDTALVTREDLEPTWDPATGTYNPDPAITVYNGKCQIKAAYSPADQSRQAGEREVTLRTYEVVLPHGAPIVELGDRLVVTASDNTWLVNVPTVVTAVDLGSNRTGQHLSVTSQRYPGGVVHA